MPWLLHTHVSRHVLQSWLLSVGAKELTSADIAEHLPQGQAHPTLSVILQRTSPQLGATMKEVKVEESPEHSLTGKLHHILVQAYRNPCKDNFLGNCFSLLIGESGSGRPENPRIQHSSGQASQKKSKGLLGEGK